MVMNEQNKEPEENTSNAEAPRIRIKGFSRPAAEEKVQRVKQNMIVGGDQEQVDLEAPVESVVAVPVKRKSPWRFVGWGFGGIGGLLLAGIAYLFIAGSMAGPTPTPTEPAAADSSSGGPVASSPASTDPAGAAGGNADTAPDASAPAGAAAGPSTGDDTQSKDSVPAPSKPVVAPSAAPVSSDALYENRLLKLSLEYPASLYVEDKQDRAMAILRDSNLSGGADLFRGDLHDTLPLVEFSLKDKWNTNIVLAIVPSGSEKVNSAFSFIVDGDFTVSDATKQQAGPKSDKFDILTYTLKNDYLTMYGSQTHLMHGGNMLVAAVISENKQEMLTQSQGLKKILQSVKIMNTKS